MIYAIEGPDKAGKTSLFEALRYETLLVTFVPKLPMVKALMPVIREVEARNEALWRALCLPHRRYVCDRHFSVTDQVYSRLYDRKPVDYSFWVSRVHPVYLRVPPSELIRRHEFVGDEFFDPSLYARVCSLYDEVVSSFPQRTVLDGTLSVEVLARQLSWLRL